MRPPQEVYGLIPVSSIDGVDASHRTRLRGFTNTVRATYGRKDAHQAYGGTLESREDLIVSNTVERGGATVYAAYSQFRLTAVGQKALFDGFRSQGPEGQEIADRYEIDDSRFQVANVGARYDPGNWFVMGEWARLESRTYFGERHGWYLTSGFRVGSLTPYVSYGRRKVDSETSHPGLDSDPEPNGVDLNAALNGLLGSAPEQQRVALGARWDFARNAALNMQYDHIDLDDDSAGFLINEQPDFRRGGTVDLISATVDFVF